MPDPERVAEREWKTGPVRAVRNTAEGISVVDVPVPDGPGVRVRVRSAGICGSDLEMVRTGLAVNTIGHEFAGVLDDGTAVAVHPYVPCGQCSSCGAGLPHLCKHISGTMLGIFVDGGMTDELRVDASTLSPLPSAVPIEDASLVEPIAVALHACNRGGVEPGMRVGVVGAGTIGLLSAAVAKHLGADVAIAARHDSQRQAAEALGVTVDASRDCDVVLEAAGTASGFDEAVRALPARRQRRTRLDDMGADRDLVPRAPRCARSRSCPRSPTARRTASASSTPRSRSSPPTPRSRPR